MRIFLIWLVAGRPGGVVWSVSSAEFAPIISLSVFVCTDIDGVFVGLLTEIELLGAI